MEWTQTSHKLPRISGRYLVLIKTATHPIISISCYTKNLYELNPHLFRDKRGRGGWYGYDGKNGYYECTGVIGWMPLPKIPVEYKTNYQKENCCE